VITMTRQENSSPHSLFQIDLVNMGSNAVDVAIEFQVSTGSVTTYVAGKGLKNDARNLKQAVYTSIPLNIYQHFSHPPLPQKKDSWKD
jgi:hypothetical protein